MLVFANPGEETFVNKKLEYKFELRDLPNSVEVRTRVLPRPARPLCRIRAVCSPLHCDGMLVFSQAIRIEVFRYGAVNTTQVLQCIMVPPPPPPLPSAWEGSQSSRNISEQDFSPAVFVFVFATQAKLHPILRQVMTVQAFGQPDCVVIAELRYLFKVHVRLCPPALPPPRPPARPAARAHDIGLPSTATCTLIPLLCALV